MAPNPEVAVSFWLSVCIIKTHMHGKYTYCQHCKPSEMPPGHRDAALIPHCSHEWNAGMLYTVEEVFWGGEEFCKTFSTQFSSFYGSSNALRKFILLQNSEMQKKKKKTKSALIKKHQKSSQNSTRHPSIPVSQHPSILVIWPGHRPKAANKNATKCGCGNCFHFWLKTRW